MLLEPGSGKDLLYQNLLGSAVNILERPDIFDVQSVLLCRKEYVINRLADDRKEVAIPGIADKVNVQMNVEVVSSGNGTRTRDVEVSSGTKLKDTLTSEVSSHASYLGMSVEAGGGYSYETSVNKSSMYALMAINQSQFYTFLSVPRGKEQDNLNPDFLAAVKELPHWEEYDYVKQQYRDFFNVWGTHVIRRCYYGCRFTLQVETEEAALTNEDEYKANVKAEFGQNFGASADFNKGKSYEEYQKKRRTTASVVGGDRANSLKLQRDPGNKTPFDSWADSIKDVENSAVTGVEVRTFGELLKECKISQGNDITNALRYFTRAEASRPITVNGYLYTSGHKTANHLEIQCWGEGITGFEVGALDEGYAEDHPSSPGVKNLYRGPNSGCFTGHVRIHGVTGKPVNFGVYLAGGSNGVHVTLLPPTGLIQIDFTKEADWNTATIPSLVSTKR